MSPGWPEPDPVGPGQESVWEYPRPPRVEASSEVVEIFFGGERIASTSSTYRVLETSHPPVYYLPTDAFRAGVLRPASGTSYCEFKGTASYLDVAAGSRTARRAAWTYPDPTPGFVALVDHVAVYPGEMDRCTVDGEQVSAQPGRFYGGWVTARIVGPFKGIPGSMGW